MQRLIIPAIIIAYANNLFAQDTIRKNLDESIKRRLTISGFCLCDVKLSDFNSSPDKFLRTNVEEMDFPKNCFGQDTRYTNGKGYYSKRYPGMIFQEGNVPGFVGKIRLTKEFKGKLPNGASVDLSAMKLRNVFES